MTKKIGVEEAYWSVFQLDLLKMVQRHRIIYTKDETMTPTQYKAAQTNAWDKIARDMRKPQKTCKQEWISIKFRYAKVINMLRQEKITQDMVTMHPTASKYLGETLDYMDDLVEDISDEEIPLWIHKRFNKMFGVTYKKGVTKEMVDALMKERSQDDEPNDEMGKIHVQKLMNIVEAAVARSLRELTVNANAQKRKPGKFYQ